VTQFYIITKIHTPQNLIYIIEILYILSLKYPIYISFIKFLSAIIGYDAYNLLITLSP
jgi:hypothetical protein